MNKKLLALTIILFLSLISLSESKKIERDTEFQQEDYEHKLTHNPLLAFLSDYTHENPEIFDLIDQLIKFGNLDPFNPEKSSKKVNPIKCETCKVVANKLLHWVKEEQKVLDFIMAFAQNVCYQKLDLYSQDVCDGLVESQAPVWFDAFWNHYLSPDFLCPALDFCHPVYEKIDIDAVIQDILKDKPQKDQLVPTQKETIKFLQLADIHTDLDYQADSKANCDQTVCCRTTAGKFQEGDEKCGYWGTLGYTDIPQRTFEKAIDFIKANLMDELDFAIWTGDNTSHNLWNQNAEDNVENTILQTNYIKSKIPADQIKMVPIFGNHEEYPANIYTYYPEDSENEFKELFANLWRDWIGDDAAQSLKEDGYYEIEFKEYNNIKIIVVNTQACYNMNVSLVYNPTDPKDTLSRLRKSLQQSEDAEQPVYIMQHIPTNKTCLNTWSRIYNAIVDRYSYTIRGIFGGHSHADELEIFYDSDTEKPINACYIAPSLTTYSNRNPSFRVFEADKETMQILNYKQYRLDLDYWNQYTDPNTELIWEVAYDFLQEYKLPNAYDFENLENLRQQVGSDLDVFNKYSKNYHSGNYQNADKVSKDKSCRMLSTDQEQAKCLGIPFEIDLTEFLAGPWIQKINRDKEFMSLD